MRDADGFTVDGPAEGERPATVRPPPPMVEMPELFRNCGSNEEAIACAIRELSLPASVELHGFDTMYRRLADALILVLANQGGLVP